MTNRVAGLGARLSKLRAMSVREVVDRLRYRAILELERRQHRRDAHDGGVSVLEQALGRDLQGRGWQDRLLAARRCTTARFLPGAHDRDRMRRLFQTRFDIELRNTLDVARQVREHRFTFFGEEFCYTAEIDWQTDPVTGNRWPARFHADVPVHGGDIGYGDVKHVWELSRQQYLIDLAKAYVLTGQSDNLRSMRHLVRSWIAGNPYGTGVNWSCALEPAFRAWSWLWAYHLTTEDLDEEFHLEWLRGFYDHARFLSKHLEHYSSPYNHLIGEAAALYALGHCFPEFRDSDQWRRRARSVLHERLREQFYTDGGSVEQSTFYHHATTGFYLLAALIGRANGDELPREVWNAIERAIDFSTRMMLPDGKTPEIGGADDGKPIRMEHLALWDFRPFQAIGAVLFGRPDFKMAAGRFYEDALWLLGPAGMDAFDGMQSIVPDTTSSVLTASGYSVDRSDWSPHADYVCFDIGEQAAGMRTDAVPNSMHGHADCLSVIISLGGRRVLVDSGLYAYNCGGVWESHFRETAAHNTARVDGRDQARHLGKMAWSHSYRAAIEGHVADARQSWTIGSHDGYARGPAGVTHRRVVWRRPGAYVVLYDEFVGSGDHELEVNYQFAPGQLTAPDDDRVVFEDFAEIMWIGNRSWTPRQRSGGPGPEDGWICGSLGVRQPAPRLTLTGRTAGERTSLLTVLAHRVGPTPRVRLVRDGSAATLLAVAGEDYTDWIAAAGVTDCDGPIQTDALVAVCRTGAGRELERASAAGSSLVIDVAALQRLESSRWLAIR